MFKIKPSAKFPLEKFIGKNLQDGEVLLDVDNKYQ